MLFLIGNVFNSVTILDLVDIGIISIIIYQLFRLMRGSRTLQMVALVIGLLLLLAVSKLMDLHATYWLISNLTGYIFIMIVITFQPEFRRMLSTIGESRFFKAHKGTSNKMLEEIVKASTMLANRQVGALIVIERQMEIENYTTAGQHINADVSRDLLISIFIPYSPLHDGAVVIKDNKLKEAGAILPLTKRVDIPSNLGTRHRAGIGITEETDAVVIIVSEERGSISVVAGGILAMDLDADSLHSTLGNLLKIDGDK